jgi:tetratricopeptide (TPR) repeat protein
MINSILERADGVPLYVEELTRGLSTTEACDAREDTGSMQALRQVPPSLNNALAARLDSVGPAREIAQFASVIGREFPSRLLSVICPLPTEQLNVALEHLLAARIIKAVPVGKDPTYIFRHALIQNAAYRTLLKSRRREIHRVLAKHLERDKEANSEVEDEVLAEHYARAGALRQAIVTRKRAAATAIERGAQLEAAKLLEAAIDTLAELSDDDEHRRLELELELTMQLATALGAIRSYAPEVEKRYLRARDLCIELNRADLRFPVEFGLTISKFVKGDLEGADSYARELFDHASRHPSKPFVDAYLANGMIRTQQGRFEEARNFFTKGAELTRPELDLPHFTHGLNPGIYCNAYLANVLAYMGRAQEAKQLIEHTLAISRSRMDDSSQVYSHVSALAIAGRVYSILRDGAAVHERSKELIEFAQRHHYSYFETIGKLQRSCAFTMEDSLESLRVGAQQMRVDLEALAQTGVRLGVQSFYVQLAEAHTRLADKVEAFANVERAVGLPDFGVRSWNAEIQRVLGEALKLPPDPDLSEALKRFQAALEIAREQGAGAFEIRAALSYARILTQMDRTTEALELLGTYKVTAEPNTLDATEINQLRYELAKDGTPRVH